MDVSAAPWPAVTLLPYGSLSLGTLPSGPDTTELSLPLRAYFKEEGKVLLCRDAHRQPSRGEDIPRALVRSCLG